VTFQRNAVFLLWAALRIQEEEEGKRLRKALWGAQL
jgi:hypothetical protein